MADILRIGIDVGGTNTDAVVMRGSDVLGAVKSATTDPVADGILSAVDAVMAQAAITASDVAAVILGTTQFTNAVVERQHLAKVAAIRASLPSGKALPPFVDWPEDLRSATHAMALPVPGGVMFDGRPISALSDETLVNLSEQLENTGAVCAAVSSAFSPLDQSDERRIADAISALLGADNIVQSASVGSIGLIERENAAILNAALLPFAQTVTESFASALKDKKFSCPLFLTQNDGTLMDLKTAARFPARTFASGPTNSLRGAALLSGVDDAIVIDIGGTTSDFGVLSKGFARQSNLGVDVGGVRTNFRMPDILAVGLGGGSLVSSDGGSIGPASVGYKIRTDALVFGGTVPTATDIAVRDAKLEIGRGASANTLPAPVQQQAVKTIHTMLDRAAARMCGRDRKPIILVGGGHVLVTQNLENASKVIRPPNADVANAVGASIAQASGEVDRVVPYKDVPRSEAIATAKREATQQAIENGAKEETIQILDLEEVPFSYTQNEATRLRVKAVGDLDFRRISGP